MNKVEDFRIKIVGTGSYLPKRVVTNEEVAVRMGSTAEWILSHTGVSTRHVAAADESSATLGTEASRAALAAAGVGADAIDVVICVTATPDYLNYPSTACLIQRNLGMKSIPAYDLAAGCSGFVYGLDVVKSHLMRHPGDRVLLVGCEVLTRSVDYADRNTAMLFGDGAGAAVIVAAPEGEGVGTRVALTLGADGGGADLIVHGGGFKSPFAADVIAETPAQVPSSYMVMDGHQVFNFAVRKLGEVLGRICGDAGVAVEELSRVFAHQANIRILEAVSRRMKIPFEHFACEIADTGNTSTASIPICLDRAVRRGELKDGELVALVGFGAGLTWGGALVEWPYV